MHLDLLNDEGKAWHWELVEAADQWRLQQRVRGKHDSLWECVRQRLGG